MNNASKSMKIFNLLIEDNSTSFQVIEEGFMNSKYGGRCAYNKCDRPQNRIDLGERIFWNANPKFVMHDRCYMKSIAKEEPSSASQPSSAASQPSGYAAAAAEPMRPNVTYVSSESKPVLTKEDVSSPNMRTGQLELHKDVYVVRFKYDPKIVEQVKSLKFKWNPNGKFWWTADASTASKFIDCVDPKDEQLKQELQKYVERASLSRKAEFKPGEEEIKIPIGAGAAAKGYDYKPYQKIGIQFAMGQDKILIADEMGLGKTIQAIGYMNMFPSEIKNILIICTAKTKGNWEKELNMWLNPSRKINTIYNKKDFPDKINNEIIIVNYDILYDIKDKIDALGELDLLVVDEAHRIKSMKAQRSEAILGTDAYTAKKKKLALDQINKPIQAKKVIFMTGTPIDNKPQDLFSILNYLDKDKFNNYYKFCIDYAGGYSEYNSAVGKSVLKFRPPTDKQQAALQDVLRRTFMIRRLKKDVLKELPPKERHLILFELDRERTSEEIKEVEKIKEKTEELTALMAVAMAEGDMAKFSEYSRLLEGFHKTHFDEMSAERIQTGTEKVPYIIKHAEDVLAKEDKVIIFVHHRDVVDALESHFGKSAVKLVGGIKSEEVTDIIDDFQTDPKKRVFIGSISACAEGITLTAASTVIFGEFDWRPTVIQQAEDRAHRIGQDKKVQIHYLAAKDTIDEMIIKSFLGKAKVNDGILDKERQNTEEVAFITAPSDLGQDYVTKNLTPQAISTEADKMTPELIDACTVLIKTLASYDQDRAREQNDIGFNKIDGMIGHSLAKASRLTARQAVVARRLIRKYKRQLSGPQLQIVLDSFQNEKPKTVSENYQVSTIKIYASYVDAISDQFSKIHDLMLKEMKRN